MSKKSNELQFRTEGVEKTAVTFLDVSSWEHKLDALTIMN